MNGVGGRRAGGEWSDRLRPRSPRAITFLLSGCEYGKYISGMARGEQDRTRAKQKKKRTRDGQFESWILNPATIIATQDRDLEQKYGEWEQVDFPCRATGTET